MNAPRSRASAHVGEVVRQLRTDATISRAKLADRADMDVTHLARIESGRGNPTLFVLIQLATALEVPVTTFVQGLTAKDLPDEVRPYSESDYRRELRARGKH
jgi:transcriptional regulator with XRE-family HTH domain